MTIFRVDNPHTKAFAFWEWMIATVRAEHPEVIFLAEAFTRPRVMERLAKIGFNQSYTYFTWRQSRWELQEYLEDLSTRTVDSFRPNFWPNTPDILTEQLQTGGPAMFASRALLAATLSPSWGVYGPAFELMEHEPMRPGSEEYLDSEKYQLRHWDLSRPSLAPLLKRLNEIRRAQPALQHLRTLTFHRADNEALLVYSKTDPDARRLADHRRRQPRRPPGPGRRRRRRPRAPRPALRHRLRRRRRADRRALPLARLAQLGAARPGPPTGPRVPRRVGRRRPLMDDVRGAGAVITGGASGIGLATARELGRAGAHVLLADIEPAALDAAVAGLRAEGIEAHGAACDVRSLDSVQALADTAFATLPGVQIVFNNAGVAVGGPVAEMSHDDWRWVIDVDLWGPIHGVEAFLPRMIDQGQGGHLLFTASFAGLVPNVGLGPYCVAKYGVVALAEVLARELREHRIGVSVLCPMRVGTNIGQSERNRQDDYGGTRELAARARPVGRQRRPRRSRPRRRRRRPPHRRGGDGQPPLRAPPRGEP